MKKLARVPALLLAVLLLCFYTVPVYGAFDQTVLEAYQMELRQKEEPVQSGPVMGGMGM